MGGRERNCADTAKMGCHPPTHTHTPPLGDSSAIVTATGGDAEDPNEGTVTRRGGDTQAAMTPSLSPGVVSPLLLLSPGRVSPSATNGVPQVSPASGSSVTVAPVLVSLVPVSPVSPAPRCWCPQ